MKYKDLKEFNVQDWDGNPFAALRIDCVDAELNDADINLLRNKPSSLDEIDKEFIFIGFVDGTWFNRCKWPWAHVYRLADNRIEPQRMTNRELSRWLAQGNGEMCEIHCKNCGNYFNYDKFCGNFEVVDTLRVRPWDSDEWVVPTKDLLKAGTK